MANVPTHIESEVDLKGAPLHGRSKALSRRERNCIAITLREGRGSIKLTSFLPKPRELYFLDIGESWPYVCKSASLSVVSKRGLGNAALRTRRRTGLLATTSSSCSTPRRPTGATIPISAR